MSSGDSTERTHGLLYSSPNLGRRVLFQAAKDQTNGSLDWLHGQQIRYYCEVIGVPHGDYCEAVRHLAKVDGAPRVLMLQNLKKRLGL